VQIPWISGEGEPDTLNDVSDQLFKAFVGDAKRIPSGDVVSASRTTDEIQPHLAGRQDFAFAGIMLQATYTAQFGPFPYGSDEPGLVIRYPGIRGVAGSDEPATSRRRDRRSGRLWHWRKR